MTTSELLTIARTPSLRHEFRQRLDLLDVAARDQIVQTVLDHADAGDESVSNDERRVELVDRAAMAPAASVTAAGLGTLIAAAFKGAALGASLGPLSAIVAGSGGLVAAAISRNILKRRADHRRLMAQRLRRLVGRG